MNFVPTSKTTLTLKDIGNRMLQEWEQGGPLA